MLSIFQQVGAISVHNPLCYQGMTNKVLNFGLFFETLCAALILYFPYSYIVNLYPVAPEWWLSALPFTLLIWGSDEVGGPIPAPYTMHYPPALSIHYALSTSSIHCAPSTQLRRYFIRLALRRDTALGDFLFMETYY